jgi:hypothetical protein
MAECFFNIEAEIIIDKLVNPDISKPGIHAGVKDSIQRGFSPEQINV